MYSCLLQAFQIEVGFTRSVLCFVCILADQIRIVLPFMVVHAVGMERGVRIAQHPGLLVSIPSCSDQDVDGTLVVFSLLFRMIQW